MPKVPIDEAQISLNVRDAGNVPYAHEFGQLGTAIAGVGQDIEQGSLTILQQVNHSAAVDAAANKFSEMKLWANETQQNLKLQSPDGMVHEDPSDKMSPIVKNQDGTPRTIAREFYDQANKKYQDGQSSMPSELASQMFRERALPHLSEQTGLLQNEVLSMRTKAGDEDQVLRAKNAGADPYNTPSMSPRVAPDGQLVMAKDPQGNLTGKPEMHINGNEYYDNVKNELQNINEKVGANYNSQGAQERAIQVKHIMTDEAARNMLNNLQLEKRLGKNGEPLDGTTKIQDIAASVAFLRGDDPQSKARKSAGLPTFSEDMDADKRDAIIGKMLSMVPKAQETDDRNYHAFITGVIENAKLNIGHQDTWNEALKQTYIRGASNPEKYGLESATTVGELVAARDIGYMHSAGYLNQSPEAQSQIARGFEIKSNQQAAKWAESIGFQHTADQGGKAAEAIQSAYKSAYDQTRDAVNRSAPGFMSTPLPVLRGNTPAGDIGLKMSQVDYGDLRNVDNPQNNRTYRDFSQMMGNSPHDDGTRLSPENSKKIGSLLQDTSAAGYSETDIAGIIGKLQHHWGSDYGRNVQQMVKSGDLPPKYALMGLHTSDDPLAQQYLVSQLRKTPESLAADEKNMGTGFFSTTATAVHAAASNQAQSWIRSLTKSDPTNNSAKRLGDEMQQVIYAGALQELRVGTASNANDAAKLSYDKLIGKFTVKLDNKNHWLETDNRLKDYVIPNVFQGRTLGPAESATIHANLNYDAKHLEQFNPTIPTQPAGTSPELVKKLAETHMQMINRTAFPVPATDGRAGSNFLYTTPSGETLPVTQTVNGREVPVFQPLEKSLKPRPQAPGLIHKVGRFMGTED